MVFCVIFSFDVVMLFVLVVLFGVNSMFVLRKRLVVLIVVGIFVFFVMVFMLLVISMCVVLMFSLFCVVYGRVIFIGMFQGCWFFR